MAYLAAGKSPIRKRQKAGLLLEIRAARNCQQKPGSGHRRLVTPCSSVRCVVVAAGLALLIWFGSNYLEEHRFIRHLNETFVQQEVPWDNFRPGASGTGLVSTPSLYDRMVDSTIDAAEDQNPEAVIENANNFHRQFPNSQEPRVELAWSLALMGQARWAEALSHLQLAGEHRECRISMDCAMVLGSMQCLPAGTPRNCLYRFAGDQP
ncbi:MAG: hypothetical protein IPJ82_09875 [Lewinellaceae bacterium]|nr:hypothetical protein [Lewinellaceae bacterium]